jgi:transcription elongation factor GreA
MAKNIRAAVSVRKNIYLTAAALDELKNEIIFLKKVKREEVAQRIQMAKELGDPSENSEYEAALDEQALVENRIAELDRILRYANVIKAGVGIPEVVVLGSTVTVEMQGIRDAYTIVGGVEANPKEKKISNESPIGSVLLGSRIGEEKEVVTPLVSYKVKVIDIK